MTTFPSDVTVAIVAHNATSYLPACLDALSAAGCPPDQIVVVDVASTDGLAGWLQERLPAATCLRLERNDGPSPGRNAGIRFAKTDYVLLMDADVQVEPQTISLLHAAMTGDANVAIGSPVVVQADRPDIIQYADTSLHFICEAINPFLGRPLAERGDDVRDIGVASTCALLLRRKTAIAIGLFDERYFIGKEDGDFTHRAKLAGHAILELPAARVRHLTKPRGSWLFYYQIRNRWHFLLKNYEWWTLCCLAPALLVHECLQFGLILLRGHGLTWFRAVWGLVQLLPSLGRDRALTSRIRVRRDVELLEDGPMVVREDLAGGFVGRVLRAYTRALSAYWWLIRRTVLR
ncbi:MAG: glycosyltransferase family 2 protein [Vicinamibacterales bacterium]